jgi:hypothetical protein
VERHPEGVALTTSRAALSSPIISAGRRLSAARDRRAPREAQRGHSACGGERHATSITSCSIEIQASARGTDAERASQQSETFLRAGGGNHGPLM